jgi:mannose-6-phosphate isomerase-like protein (cupin superfamily)
MLARPDPGAPALRTPAPRLVQCAAVSGNRTRVTGTGARPDQARPFAATPGRDKEMTHALSELMARQVARFVDRVPDWDAFADARVEGYRRAQHRFIGAGASGKTDGHFIPADHFTLSIMFVPPGQGNAAHTHEVEEVFFILRGRVKVFFEDGAGSHVETVLGPWDCVSCPANVIHGYENVGLEGAYLQVMLGKARPDLMQYADGALQARRDEHLRLAP